MPHLEQAFRYAVLLHNRKLADNKTLFKIQPIVSHIENAHPLQIISEGMK